MIDIQMQGQGENEMNTQNDEKCINRWIAWSISSEIGYDQKRAIYCEESNYGSIPLSGRWVSTSAYALV